MTDIDTVLAVFPRQFSAVLEAVADLKHGVDRYRAENERLAAFSDLRIEVSGMILAQAEDEVLPLETRKDLLLAAATLWEQTEEEYQSLLAAANAAEASVEEVRATLADRTNTLRLMLTSLPGDGAQEAIKLLDLLEQLSSCSSGEDARRIFGTMVDAFPELILVMR